jgi:hypothetical protein
VCGSLWGHFFPIGGGVDERVKAFLDSAVTVQQQQRSNVLGRSFAADRIWLGSGRFPHGRAARRAFRIAPSKRPNFVFALWSFDKRKPDIQCNAGKVGYGQASRRIIRWFQIDRG